MSTEWRFAGYRSCRLEVMFFFWMAEGKGVPLDHEALERVWWHVAEYFTAPTMKRDHA